MGGVPQPQLKLGPMLDAAKAHQIKRLDSGICRQALSKLKGVAPDACEWCREEVTTECNFQNRCGPFGSGL